LCGELVRERKDRTGGETEGRIEKEKDRVFGYWVGNE